VVNSSVREVSGRIFSPVRARNERAIDAKNGFTKDVNTWIISPGLLIQNRNSFIRKNRGQIRKGEIK
jgi:hypothetical protein